MAVKACGWVAGGSWDMRRKGDLFGLARNELRNRRLLTVVGRVFNPRDNQDYVALIVEERVPTEAERVLVG